MKEFKVFDISEIPKEFHSGISEKSGYGNFAVLWYNHVNSKPLEQHNGGEILWDSRNDSGCSPDFLHIIERGDHPLSDFFMDNGANFGEDVYIQW
jgi:hypothetical protein